MNSKFDRKGKRLANKKPNRRGCFIGDLMQEYHLDLEALLKDMEARDV